MNPLTLRSRSYTSETSSISPSFNILSILVNSSPHSPSSFNTNPLYHYHSFPIHYFPFICLLVDHFTSLVMSHKLQSMIWGNIMPKKYILRCLQFTCKFTQLSMCYTNGLYKHLRQGNTKFDYSVNLFS